MAHNQRSLTRHTLGTVIDVWDAQANVNIGRLANIHSQGCMLLSDRLLVEDKLYQIRLALPQSFSTSGELSFGVDCLWVKAAEDGGNYWAGCQIIDISDLGLEAIQLLTSRLAAS